MDALFHDGDFAPNLLCIGDLSAPKTLPSRFIHNFDGLATKKKKKRSTDPQGIDRSLALILA